MATPKTLQEIAKRTREVLEQFERNADQQNFLLMIFEKLDERTSQVVTPSPPWLGTWDAPLPANAPADSHASSHASTPPRHQA